jgi:hypothetical protein
MGKMYYSEEETKEILGVDQDGLMELVNSAQLQMYQDGPKHVYKATDVDALAQGMGPDEQADVLEAQPASTDAYDSLGLEDADGLVDSSAPPKKEDTVITAEGISIFDDEDLEIEEADPSARTQVAPSLDDQVALDGVGSGSGLLDLTRESDDTSLGAEVLDHIDMEGVAGSGLGSGLIGADLSGSGMGSGMEGVEPTTADMAATSYTGPVEQATYVETSDAFSGFCGGMLVAVAALMTLVTAASLGMLFEQGAGLISALHNQLLLVLIGSVVLVVVFGVIGLFVGRSMASKRQAMQRMA